jgi:hypothetical protein
MYNNTHCENEYSCVIALLRRGSHELPVRRSNGGIHRWIFIFTCDDDSAEVFTPRTARSEMRPLELHIPRVSGGRVYDRTIPPRRHEYGDKNKLRLERNRSRGSDGEHDDSLYNDYHLPLHCTNGSHPTGIRCNIRRLLHRKTYYDSFQKPGRVTSIACTSHQSYK